MSPGRLQSRQNSHSLAVVDCAALALPVRSMRPKTKGLPEVYAKAYAGEAMLWDAWVQELRPTTWDNVQKGYKVFVKNQAPSGILCLLCLLH